MPRRPRALLGVAIGGMIAVAIALPAQAKTSHADRFSTFKFRVGCGVQLRSAGGGMSCFSQALPHTDLDGFIELHRHGKSKLGERGDSPWVVMGSSTRIKKGDRWSRVGVSCVVRTALRCENADGHGFKLTPKRFSRF
jgi:hypothetical protein